MANGISLAQALGLFVQGAQDFGRGQTIRQFNQKAVDIRADSGLSEVDRRNELANTAKELGSSLAAKGVSAGQIQAATSGINPDLPRSIEQALLVGTFTGNKDMVASGQAALDAMEKPAFERFVLKQNQAEIKSQRLEGQKKENFFLKQRDLFRDKVAKKDIEALAEIDNAVGIATQGIERGDAALKGILARRMARGIAGEVGRLTEQDVLDVGASPAILRRLKRSISLALTGKAPSLDFLELRTILQVARVRKVKRVRDLINSFSASRQSKAFGITENQFKERLFQEMAGIDRREVETRKDGVKILVEIDSAGKRKVIGRVK